ncbi:PsiF family protein [Noviherbaspirillum saxi]|uniref:Phosphate starvation-inducible protein PsiF n=1 Tax=Noviherbaspirillum saxi TaxID=2320863 RepID=A0A3A3FRS2_9BURK|nr:PsiF family protein [Noviherbaspirillum saxi]RJF97148.1 phosphate starvation-inducible protein PsiF [Noviherbaspirillum saxi]
MKVFAGAIALVLPMLLQPALAATDQQNKMTVCNKEAEGKKGDERKAFMKECLSSKPKVSEAQKAQQDKMKSCNAEAKGKAGDERKKFMSECLKKG